MPANMKFLTLIVTLLLSVPAISQVKVSGTVTGTDMIALQGAIVTVYNNDKIVSYTIVRSDGSYEFKTTSPFTHVDYSHMGYKRVRFRIASAGESLVHNVVMEEEPLELEQITIKPMAVTVRNDTVTYDATAFVRKEDNSLQEILNRLPDVKVSSNGTVKVQGMNVNKVYIEDLDLLGGRYGLAIKNIRPSDIAAVSVYYNHQPISALRGVLQSDQAALNIKLKEKAKGKWLYSFGGKIGTRTPDILYQGKLNAMNFKRGRQTMVIAKSDNSGDDIIGETRLNNLKPGGYLMSDLQNLGFEKLFSTGTAILPLPQNYYYDNKSNAISVNNLNRLSKESTIKENVVFYTDSRRDNVYTHKEIRPENSDPIIIADSMRHRNTDKQLEGEITYTLNGDKKYIENILSVKTHFNEAGNRLKSLTGGYTQDYSLPQFSIENKFSMVKNNGGKVRRVNADVNYRHQKQSMSVFSENLSQLFGSHTVTQDFRTDFITGNFYTSYTAKLGKGLFTAEPGLKAEYSDYESVVTPQSDSTFNDIALFSLQPYADLRYDVRKNNMTLQVTFPIGARADFKEGNLAGRDNTLYLIYSPKVTIEYILGNSLKLKGSASVGNNIGGVRNMGDGYTYTGYRNLYRYREIPKTVNQLYYISLNHSDLSRFLYTSLYFNYSVNHSNMAQEELYLKDYTFITYINEPTDNRRFSASASLKKMFGRILTLGGSVSYSYERSEQYLQGKFYRYETQSVAGSMNAEFTPAENFSLSYTGGYTHSMFDASSSSSIDHLTTKVTAGWFPVKSLLLKGEFYHFLQSSNKAEIKNISLPFLDFVVEYWFSSKIKLYGQLKNVLNTKEYKYSYFSGVSTTSTITRLRGAEYMVGFAVSL